MKLNKFIPLLTSLAIISTPLVSLSSCNGQGGHEDPSEHIDVKIPEVITPGQKLEITYELDDGYSIDVANSSLTFDESNGDVIPLGECEIEGNKITVPDYFVKSSQLKANIVSAKTVNNMTKESYAKAINALYHSDSNSNFKVKTAYSQLTGNESQVILGTTNFNLVGDQTCEVMNSSGHEMVNFSYFDGTTYWYHPYYISSEECSVAGDLISSSFAFNILSMGYYLGYINELSDLVFQPNTNSYDTDFEIPGGWDAPTTVKLHLQFNSKNQISHFWVNQTIEENNLNTYKIEILSFQTNHSQTNNSL